MQIEKRTIEVDDYVRSEDGHFQRSLRDKTEEERTKIFEEVRKYESSAKGVLYARLISKGVLKEVRPSGKQWETLTDEEKKQSGFFFLLDAVMDSEYGRNYYYLFTPQTEDDIKDYYNYQKLLYDCSVDGKDSDYHLITYDVKVGGTYILSVNPDCEWCTTISPDKVTKRVDAMAKYYEKLGEEQKKSIKK